MADEQKGLIAGIVRTFLEPRYSILLILFSLALGAAALFATPREEEPQITVPMADVIVTAPGAGSAEIEQLVATPLERLLWQTSGVEYVYSVSRPDTAVVTVRFFVGQDREESLVKLHNTLMMHQDLVPRIVKGWIVKPVEVDDVPIVTLALSSDRYDEHDLRRIGEELFARLSETPDLSKLTLVGGLAREVRIELSPERLAGMGLSPLEVAKALGRADMSVRAGAFDMANREYVLTADSFLLSAGEVADLVVGVSQGRPVYLRDVADVRDGPEEPRSYSRIGFPGKDEATASVTLALAKKRGVNAVAVSDDIQARIGELAKSVLPDGVAVTVTRDYGATARDKVSGLIRSLAEALATVILVLLVFMGWREALVVGVAVPVSFGLALFVSMMLGYSINRVTLFALILSLGLVVDDPIVNVDNIQRHILAGKRKAREATLFAVTEVLPPVIMSSLTIIVSFLPLYFISGMMGPYMAPMAAGVPLAIVFSTLASLTIVPWLAYVLLRHKRAKPGAERADADAASGAMGRLYRRVIEPFLDSRPKRWGLIAGILVLLGFSVYLPLARRVPLKLLPFDNKNELQLVIDLPEGSTLEATDRAVRDFEAYLARVPDVANTVSFVGAASPMDFNGMVRHYYLRGQSNQADIRVNLKDRAQRTSQSHGLALALRKDLEGIARQRHARLAIVETPPGPPVLSTLVAEVYGAPDTPYARLLDGAAHMRRLMAREPFVVDISDTSEARRDKASFVLDKEKAALHGVAAEDVTATLALAMSGTTPATVHEPGERRPLPARLVLSREKRASEPALGLLPVRTESGRVAPLAELGLFSRVTEDQPIYHKDLKPVVYVQAEMAGRSPVEAVLDLEKRLAHDPLPYGVRVDFAGEGEWKITVDVFRDLGVAFGAALIGIYILLVIETKAFALPLLLMTAIPLTLIGVMPGFWLLNVFFAGKVGDYADPIFFTATSMIGMIALGGIVIRNSLVLINFIDETMGRGLSLREAVLRSGAVRFRPILLTAMTTALGAWPITLDPIFSGLAWALIFGLSASTLFSLVVIPVAYYAVKQRADA